jgi:lysophospholipase L1-like esterase
MPRQFYYSTPQKPYLYLPDGWDAGLKNGIASSQSNAGPLRIACFGDSITLGQMGTDVLLNGFPWLLRQALIQRYGLYGDHWCAAQNGTLNGTSAYFPFTFAGTGAVGQQDGYGYQQAYNPTGFGTAHDITFQLVNGAPNSLSYPFTGLDIVLAHFNASGTFTWNVDGAGATTHTNTTNDGLLEFLPIRGLAAGSHTVVFSNTSAVTALTLAGITTYSGSASGLFFANHGQPNQTIGAAFNAASHTLLAMQGYSGASSPNALAGSEVLGVNVVNGGTLYSGTPTAIFSNPATGGTVATGTPVVASGAITSITMTGNGSNYQGPCTVSIGNPGGGSGFVGQCLMSNGAFAPSQVDVAIIALGVNDMARAKAAYVGPQGMEHVYRQMIAAIRYANPNASILFVGIWNGTLGSHTDDTGFTNSNSWHLYLNRMRNLAATQTCGFLDLSARWGSTPIAQGFISAGSAHHPTTAGHADIFAALKPAFALS